MHNGNDCSTYNNYQLSSTFGFGVDFENVLYLELEWNRDILYPINTATLNLWNTCYAVNVGINIPGLVKSLSNNDARVD